jgi:hypothetical protein
MGTGKQMTGLHPLSFSQIPNAWTNFSIHTDLLAVAAKMRFIILSHHMKIQSGLIIQLSVILLTH